MTANVLKVLEKIKNSEVFSDELFFVGGTALSYYLNHRISEDIDLASSTTLQHQKILPMISSFGAVKVQDENVTALRMAGLFPDEYMIKFILDNVKIEFFQVNRPIQKEILQNATYTSFQDSNLKILDVKSIAKLKLVALIQREKSRDLFDFGVILENKILSIEEILDICVKINKINNKKELTKFIEEKKEPMDDESVYLTEDNRLNLTFDEIKSDVLRKLNL